jgi:hypothetical protein
MVSVETCADSMELLQELRVMAPDVWAGSNRRLILPPKLGDFEKPEYIRKIRDIIRKLNEYISMLDAGLISEEEYERKKAEILSSMQSW